jgi:hypothetical protein
VVLTLMTGSAWADEDRCLPGARLSVEVAQKREAGKDEGEILKELEREGRFDTQAMAASLKPASLCGYSSTRSPAATPTTGSKPNAGKRRAPTRSAPAIAHFLR